MLWPLHSLVTTVCHAIKKYFLNTEVQKYEIDFITSPRQIRCLSCVQYVTTFYYIFYSFESGYSVVYLYLVFDCVIKIYVSVSVRTRDYRMSSALKYVERFFACYTFKCCALFRDFLLGKSTLSFVISTGYEFPTTEICRKASQ